MEVRRKKMNLRFDRPKKLTRFKFHNKQEIKIWDDDIFYKVSIFWQE